MLRIEDTDAERNRPEWTQGIIDALAWIGIHADDPHFEGPYFQSQYAERTSPPPQRLFDDGHAYYCDMTADQIQARAKDRGHHGLRRLVARSWARPGPGPRAAVPGARRHDRRRRPRARRGHVRQRTIEDFVLVRGNGTPMFLLGQRRRRHRHGITHVVRAEEHLPNTPKQQMLWKALGHSAPGWAHVPVLVNEQRKKLSKRRDKVALEQYRDEGYLADAMVNYLMTLGWTPPGAEAAGSEIVAWPEIEAAFRLDDVTHSPAFFDVKKLAAFNGDYIRMMPLDEFVERAGEELPADWDRARFAAIAPHIQERLTTLREVPEKIDFLFWPDDVDVDYDSDSWAKAFGPDWAAPLLADVIDAYELLDDWFADGLKVVLEDVMTRYELKLGKAQAPVRVAVTGRTVGPPLFESMEVLGRAETLRRLSKAVAVASEAAPGGGW